MTSGAMKRYKMDCFQVVISPIKQNYLKIHTIFSMGKAGSICSLEFEIFYIFIKNLF